MLHELFLCSTSVRIKYGKYSKSNYCQGVICSKEVLLIQKQFPAKEVYWGLSNNHPDQNLLYYYYFNGFVRITILHIYTN